MSEIALVSARKSKLETEAKKGGKAARKALKLTNDPNKFLSTVQIGITLTGILTGLFAGEKIIRDFESVVRQIDSLAPYSKGIANTSVVVIVTYLTLVFGELVPKRLGMSKAESVSKLMASPMSFLSAVTSPLVLLLSKSTSILVKFLKIKTEENKVTEDEIKAIVKEGFDGGEVQEVEHDIVERVFNLGDRDVDSIMTHRSDLVCLYISDNKTEIREKVIANMHNIYPVMSRDFGQVLGIVSLKDLFGRIDSPDFLLEKLIVPAQFFPENQSVYKALEQFKQTKTKYGLVINEFGDIQGIVTLSDIMEALVGQVSEDNESEIIPRDDSSFLVDGKCSFYNFLEYFDMEYLYAEHEYNTLSGLILAILEHLPETGEKLSWNKFSFEIIDMDGARIDKVLVIMNS
jgi:putative hemolysin